MERFLYSQMTLTIMNQMTADNLPRFVSPLSTSHLNYADRIRQFNRAFQRRVSDAIEAKFGYPGESDFAVFTTGSDGRLEKGPQSKVEIVVSGRKNYENEARVVENEIKRRLGDVLDPDIEHKTLGVLYIAGYNSSLSFPFPTRVLDLRLLYGDKSVRPDALEQLRYELTLQEGSRIIDGMNAKRRESRKVCETGTNKVKGAEFVHFDLGEGVSHYDEKKKSPSRLSFKTGPLRLVQYGLATEILRKVRDGEFSLDFLEDFPTPISERLYFLETEGKTKLSHSEIETLAESYDYFIWQYHLSQEYFREHGQTRVDFDKKEVGERLRDLVRLVGDRRLVK